MEELATRRAELIIVEVGKGMAAKAAVETSRRRTKSRSVRMLEEVEGDCRSRGTWLPPSPPLHTPRVEKSRLDADDEILRSFLRQVSETASGLEIWVGLPI